MGERRDRFLERLPLGVDRPVAAHAAALLISATALGARLASNTILPPGYPYLTFFPAVILTSFLFGRGPGILSALLCGLSAWLFFIGPGPGVIVWNEGIALSLAFYTMVVVIDIALVHWMQRANRRLVRERERGRLLVERGDLLFRELQHRVSNNIQVVAALLVLQKRSVSDPAARAALDDASRRMGLIGRIHRQLHDPSGGRQDMAAFLRSIAADLVDASGRNGIAVDVDVDDAIQVDADAAIPIALIVSEAIANAFEHGFGERDTGRITIALHRWQAGFELAIGDDGKGLPIGFDGARTDSLGLRIARTLATQIGGSFELVPQATGAVCRVRVGDHRPVQRAGSRNG